MAFYFSNDARAEGAVLPVSATPLTMACWFRADDATARHTLMSIGNGLTGANQQFWELRASGDVAGDPIQARAQSGTGGNNATTTTGYSATTWHHACGVFTSATSRTAYIDGGSAHTETTSRAPTSLVGTTIAARYGIADSAVDLNGQIAEMAIWNVALTAAEVAALAAGASPTRIRPDALVWYNAGHGPTTGTIYSQIRGGNGLAITGTVTIQDHAPKVWVPFGADLWARYAGGGGTTYNITPDGTITPAGALVKTTTKILSGALTTAGALVKTTTKVLAGTLTTAGALVKTTTKVLAGTLTSAGALVASYTANVILAGTLTTAGALVHTTIKLLAATLTTAGALVQSVTKPLTGALTTAGAVTMTVAKALTGTLTSDGALTAIKAAVVTIAGTLTTAGALAQTAVKPLAASLTPTGALVKTVTKAFASTLTSAGAVVKTTTKAFASTLTSAGAVVQTVTKVLAGALTTAGALVTQTIVAGQVFAARVEIIARAVTVEVVTRAAALVEIITRRQS